MLISNIFKLAKRGIPAYIGIVVPVVGSGLGAWRKIQVLFILSTIRISIRPNELADSLQTPGPFPVHPPKVLPPSPPRGGTNLQNVAQSLNAKTNTEWTYMV